MYVDPGTFMPVATAIAAVTGILLMFWRRTVAFMRSGVEFFRARLSRLFGRG